MSRRARAISSLSVSRSAVAASESFVSSAAVERRRCLLDQHERAVLGELQVALGLREAHDLGLRAVQAQLGGLEHREHRLVVGEDADRADGGERGEHLDLLGEHLPLGGEHFELGTSRAAIGYFLAASTTSSIVPFRKNARSGTSSCLPSMISSKPRIVSAIGT